MWKFNLVKLHGVWVGNMHFIKEDGNMPPIANLKNLRNLRPAIIVPPNVVRTCLASTKWFRKIVQSFSIILYLYLIID